LLGERRYEWKNVRDSRKLFRSVSCDVRQPKQTGGFVELLATRKQHALDQKTAYSAGRFVRLSCLITFLFFCALSDIDVGWVELPDTPLRFGGLEVVAGRWYGLRMAVKIC